MNEINQEITSAMDREVAGDRVFGQDSAMGENVLGYVCKYTPIELFESFGFKPELIDAESRDFTCAETRTHANLCSHAKSLIGAAPNYENLALVDCCDSLRRTFDVLDAAGEHEYLALLDLPHEREGCAKKRFAATLGKLCDQLEDFTGRAFDAAAFCASCATANDSAAKRDPLSAVSVSAMKEPFYAVVGARVSPPLLAIIRSALGYPVVNLTCSGNRVLEELPPSAETLSREDLLTWYANALLAQTPCMRMADVTARRALTEHPQLVGIIYNTVKFCDFYGFDHWELSQQTAVPILKIESDYTPTPQGQLSTRLEAFRESIEGDIVAKHTQTSGQPGEQGERTTGGRFFAGIDSGSTTTNIVVLDNKGDVVASTIVRTGAKAQNGAQAALDDVCTQLGATPDDFAAIVATGYGRENIPFATSTVTEITCHAKGAHEQQPQVRTIIDIGGQDSKVICLDEEGHVTNFAMNDKCAAGTGRFLEAMARTLELELEEMAVRGLESKQDLTISSMCTVFAESEVISLVADNHQEADIIHGLNKSIASRTSAMVTRVKGEAPYMMTGGVARNRGVVAALEERLGDTLYVTEEPDLCGAYGAALFALDSAS